VRIAYKRGLPGVVACCGVGAMIYGVGYLFVSWSTALIFAAFGAFLAHLGGGMQWSSVIFGIAKTAPDEVRGRIGAADFALVTFSMSVSLALAGWASSKWGPFPPSAYWRWCSWAGVHCSCSSPASCVPNLRIWPNNRKPLRPNSLPTYDLRAA
jgi:MFS family permease